MCEQRTYSEVINPNGLLWDNIMPINIGHGNFCMSDFVAIILHPGSSHIKNIRDDAAEKGLLFKATVGEKARSVIIQTNCKVTLSVVQPTTLKNRLEAKGIKMVSIGYEGYFRLDILNHIFKPDGSSMYKLRKDTAEKGLLINGTFGHKTRSMIELSSFQYPSFVNSNNHIGRSDRSN